MGSTTPLWVPLVVAVLGVLGTVVAGVIGVVITQRWSDRREAKTAERERQREQERWERERERERERWAREDVARTFDRRSASYLDFYSAVGQEYLSLMEVFSRRRWHSEPDAHAPDEVRDAVFKTLEEVRVYGSQTVVETAEEIFDHLALTESEPTTANLEELRGHGRRLRRYHSARTTRTNPSQPQVVVRADLLKYLLGLLMQQLHLLLFG